MWWRTAREKWFKAAGVQCGWPTQAIRSELELMELKI